VFALPLRSHHHPYVPHCPRGLPGAVAMSKGAETDLPSSNVPCFESGPGNGAGGRRSIR